MVALVPCMQNMKASKTRLEKNYNDILRISDVHVRTNSNMLFFYFFFRQAQFLGTLELRKKAVNSNIYLNEKIKVNLRYDLM